MFLYACDSSRYQQISGFTQGTSYHITVDLPADKTMANVQGAVDLRLREIDKSLSTYRNDSEISRFNALPVSAPVSLGSDFVKVLGISREVYRLSGKVFDPTVKPLIDLWGFGASGEPQALPKIPDEQAIKTAMQLIGFDAVQNNGLKVYKTQTVSVDFNGVAQGYTVDAIAKVLDGLGARNYMVEIGGEVATKGMNPQQSFWRIGIDKPEVNNFQHQIAAKLRLHNAHVSTSGDYREYYEVAGKRYSHTIDPRNGKPVDHRLASVTVIADSVALADAWCTALMVLGEIEGYQLAERLNMAAYFIYRNKGGFSVKTTKAMSPYLE